MAASILSLLGWREESQPPLRPPATIVTGVRIPVDGSRAHLVPLSTIVAPDSATRDGFLVHIPDLRPYWKIDNAWTTRDIHRLDLQLHDKVEPAHHSRLKHDVQRLLLFELGGQERLHLRQRYLGDQQRYLVQQQYSSLAGTYYIFYSYALDDLPKNESVPAWISRTGDRFYQQYWGDVFLVKVALCENGEDGQAIYEDILPTFLDLLDKAPVSALPTCSPTLSPRPFFDEEAYHTTNNPLTMPKTEA